MPFIRRTLSGKFSPGQTMVDTTMPEPWLSGTLPEIRSVPRAVLHSLELAHKDLKRWCGNLSDEQLNARPAGIAPISFHIRHIARSIDRLLTYTEGNQLNDEQIVALKSELDPNTSKNDLFLELETSLTRSAARIRQIDAARLEEARFVGRKKLPATLGGLLVHVADHTQRHLGQAITTARIVAASGS